MVPEIESFRNWLRRKAPHASTPRHYVNDLELFFAWLGKPSQDVIRMELRMGAAGVILIMTSDGNASGARSVWASRRTLWDV
jgi:hypothetical protein